MEEMIWQKNMSKMELREYRLESHEMFWDMIVRGEIPRWVGDYHECELCRK